MRVKLYTHSIKHARGRHTQGGTDGRTDGPVGEEELVEDRKGVVRPPEAEGLPRPVPGVEGLLHPPRQQRQDEEAEDELCRVIGDRGRPSGMTEPTRFCCDGGM